MVEDVEGVRAEFEVEPILRQDREGPRQAGIHIESSWTAEVIPLSDLETGRTDEIGEDLVGIGVLVEEAVLLVDASLQIGLVGSNEDRRRVVGVTGDEGILKSALCLTGVIVVDGRDAPAADRFIEPARIVGEELTATTHGQVVDEVAVEVLGDVEVGVSSALARAGRIADESLFVTGRWS